MVTAPWPARMPGCVRFHAVLSQRRSNQNRSESTTLRRMQVVIGK
jgi:hypothetical protein